METIILQKEENIAVLTISRPKALNALNTKVLKELDGAIDEIENDNEIYALVITGDGEKAFVAGADIAEMKDMNPKEARNFSILGNKVFRRIESLRIPTIAAVNGYALGGGCELAMACDIRIASETAKFGQPEVGLGITPGFGGTQRLSRIVGKSKAKELIFTGDVIDANEALRIGLVNKVVKKEELIDEAKKLANKISQNAPIAVGLAKAAIDRGYQADIDTAIMYEAEVFSQCFATEDQKDGMTAFTEKRKVEKFKNK
ncbi:putative enoyl-CoA hydratase echA8 [Caloramator mitchellensis]|uniref:short-chain-enoyl-CoA hydratase n=1 Tax=Caloramator mitchellensis TaxID=908809 RepID=A0A0R3K3A5_CALMK|nr:short-chain-enoyl-CoA hydratase [Caloramator mitchellensis]KRQ87892.1 putative enoyl-CoA hydratase echA8 [Caloramator mitchellensis]